MVSGILVSDLSSHPTCSPSGTFWAPPTASVTFCKQRESRSAALSRGSQLHPGIPTWVSSRPPSHLTVPEEKSVTLFSAAVLPHTGFLCRHGNLPKPVSSVGIATRPSVVVPVNLHTSLFMFGYQQILSILSAKPLLTPTFCFIPLPLP